MGTGISWLRSEVCEPFIYGKENVDKENVLCNFPLDPDTGDPDPSVELVSSEPAHWRLGKI